MDRGTKGEERKGKEYGKCSQVKGRGRKEVLLSFYWKSHLESNHILRARKRLRGLRKPDGDRL